MIDKASHYKCILFDLDHTLWDYETNSGEALAELYVSYELAKQGACDVKSFCDNFTTINTQLWDQYDRGEIHRDILRTERFHRVLVASGVDNYDMSLRFSADYLSESPKKKAVMPGAIEALEYLGAKYKLYIITNGFAEVQSTKMLSSGILSYFSEIFTSEQIGHKKPSREIFDRVLDLTGYHAKEAMMIGDNLLTDILGAQNAGIDHVFYNPNGIAHKSIVTHEIQDLLELKQIL